MARSEQIAHVVRARRERRPRRRPPPAEAARRRRQAAADADPDLWNRVGHLAATLTRQELLELPGRRDPAPALPRGGAAPLRERCRCASPAAARATAWPGVLRMVGRARSGTASPPRAGSLDVTCEFCGQALRRSAARRRSARSPTRRAGRRPAPADTGRLRATRRPSTMTTPSPRAASARGGPEITTVGFGAWAVGGGGWAFAWGPQDDEESIAAIRHAVARGVNWIDTAAVYGYGHSEEVVGRALAEHPRLRAAARLHEVRPALERRGPHGAARARLVGRRASARSARTRCAGSASRRSTSTSSTGPTRRGRRSRTPGARCCSLVEEGKVRWAGVSNYDAALLERCEARRPRARRCSRPSR